MVVRGLVGWGKRGDIGQMVQTSSYKINKFWGSNVQHGDCSSQYCTVYLKGTRRVDLKCSHHQKKKKSGIM